MTSSSAESDRHAWAAEVLDFLSWRGRQLFRNWSPQTVPELIRLLSGRDWELILTTNVLASPQFHSALRDAIRLVPRELRRDRAVLRSVSRGRLRGRVIPGATVRARARSSDSTLWVTARAADEWQTPANGAIAGFLAHLFNVATSAHAPELLTQNQTARTGLVLLERLLRAEPLRRVRPDPHWSSQDVFPWLRAESALYRSVWDWAQKFRAARSDRTAESLRETVLNGWLASESDDTLFELFALSIVMQQVAALRQWDSMEIVSSLAFARDIALTATCSGIRIEVRYDRTPPVRGRYTALLTHYKGIDGAGRRPDILIASRVGNEVRSTLLEVKATGPNTRYGRDSIVKVFGYLKDFENLWQAGSTSYPKAMLLYAEDVGPVVGLADRAASDEVLLSSPSTIRDDIDTVLQLLTDEPAPHEDPSVVEEPPAGRGQ